jgi:26S proteasome regulatory subunit N8
MWVLYAASLIRSIIALHNLINNKLTNKEAEKKEATSKKEDKEKKEDKDKVEDRNKKLKK